jgi:acetoin utilization protein AcuB
MTRPVVTIEREASLRRARRIMDNRGIRHLPVVEKDRLVGLVTDRDIRAAAPSSAAGIAPEVRDEFLDHLKVGHIMTRKVLTTTPETTIEEAARLMRQHKVGCLPVLEGERLVGIITETDIFGVLVEVLGVGESMARLEITCHPRPGFVTDVVRMVDDQGGRVVSLLTTSGGEGGAVLILRVDTPDAASLCQVLRQAGCSILSVEHPTPERGKKESERRGGEVDASGGGEPLGKR